MEMVDAKIETAAAEKERHFIDEVEIFRPGGAEYERLQEELASERDARLRLAAEFDDYRRRTRMESAKAAEEGKRELLEVLVSIADDLDLALGNLAGPPEAIASGVRMIRRRFRDVLEANGVTAFDSEGEKFDPERHEAFDVVTATEGERESVQTEIRRGYLWNGRLLRPALVIVAQ